MDLGSSYKNNQASTTFQAAITQDLKESLIRVLAESLQNTDVGKSLLNTSKKSIALLGIPWVHKNRENPSSSVIHMNLGGIFSQFL